MLSSSSRRESRMAENPQTKKVGCMSGIFFFLSMNRHNSRKRLLSGKNRSGSSNSGSSSKTPESPPENPPRAAAAAPPAAVSSGGKSTRRLSCEAPRSPTLPSEIRRLDSPVCSPRKPPALVARLMGLDDSPPPPPQDSSESAAEKRRKLLGALERCDEDLLALKKIIDALRAVETHRYSGGGAAAEEKRCLEEEDGKPSPVSVLDAPFSSPVPAVRWKQQQLPPRQPPGGDVEDDLLLLDDHHIAPQAFACIKAPPSLPPQDQRPVGQTNLLRRRRRWRRRLPCSKAMAQSVEEVSESGVWEEMWELDRIWLELEGSILGDLVAELVKELGFRRGRPSSLPFFAGCRKRLFF